MTERYKKRIADSLLERKLRGKGAVLIEGPKWCGKTTTAEQMAGSILRMDDPAQMAQNTQLAEINPSALLVGTAPRLIDEWQLAPQLWDAVRFEVDHRKERGQFILTGSAVPADRDKIFHTGTGRFSWLIMRPMSLYESGDSTGEVSLAELFSAPKVIQGSSSHSLADMAYLICRGGWPEACDMESDIALDQAKDYVDAIVNADISRVDNVARDEQLARLILRSYARNQGSQATLGTIRADVSAGNRQDYTEKTISSYINAMRKIFVVEDMHAWNPNLRSKTAIRTSDTRYFVDPSIAAASLGLGPEDLMADLNTMGLMFETLCIRDLRIFADAIDGEVCHFRDKNGLECDAVVHLRNGHYGLVEIKLGGETLIGEGVKTLTTLASLIDTDKMPAPSFCMVLTAVGNYAYRRKDGIYIVPAGALRN